MLRTFIDRPVTVTMIALVVIVLGLVSVHRLPVSLIPDVDVPYITVQASSAELSAREMDQSVLLPLRQQLIQIDGLEGMTSEASDGSGTVRLTFRHGAPMGYLFIEVNEKIDRSMGSLPGISRPKVLKASAADIPAFFVNITADEPSSPGGEASSGADKDLFPVSEEFSALSRFASQVIIKRIEQLPEVAMADISGILEDEILILPDETKLGQLGMTMGEFESVVRSANITFGSLTIRDGEYRYNVKFDSRASSAEDIAAIWIKRGDRLLQVRDIARVITHPAKRTGLVRSDGQDAVCLAVIKQSDARMSALKKSMDALMDQFREDYPSLHFQVTRDQTTLLEYSISNLLRNIIVALLLACVVIFLFMRDFRSPALVALTMPVALVFSMLCFYLIGLSLNIISLSGVLLGVGMMTDNTIVLVDNITGRWGRGDSLRDAVLKGTREVMGPMLSSVLTTCAVFIPLVFLNGIAGAMFYDQAMGVTIVLLTSYIVTVTIIPVYYYWWYKGLPSFRPSPLLERINLETPLQRWDDRWMKWFLHHRGLSWGLLAISAAAAVFLFFRMPKERLPRMTQTDAILKIDWNEHISLEQGEERIRRIEDAAAGKANQITALLGSQSFVLGHSGDLDSPSQASVYFSCPDPKTLERVKDELDGLLNSAFPHASFSFEPSGNIFDMVFSSKEAPLTAKLRPARSAEVEVAPVREIVSRLREALPGVPVKDPSVKTDVLFISDPELLALYGVSASDLLSVLRNALNENRLFSIVQGTRSVPVVTGSNSDGLEKILSGTFVEKKADDGQGMRIPVSSLMRQTLAEDFKTIVAGTEGGYYPVDFDVPSRDVPRVMAAVRETVRRDGRYEAGFTGAWFSSRALAGQMALILLVAVALLYLILASQFESLVQPLIILSEIVIDIAASLAVLWAFGVSVNLMSMIGLVVITGIVINDSILKIDTINRMRRSGESLQRAVMDASSRRMKAIIMTSLTTILAVCPFLARGSMGADLQYPMSLVVIAGMTVGTLVSLFVVPSLYYSIYNGRKGK